MDIVTIINDIRKEQGMSWAQLSEISTVTEATMFNWRHGKSQPTLSRVEMVLEALNHELEVLQK
jgi:transcriptional regulator with XRE-family HTH domain